MTILKPSFWRYGLGLQLGFDGLISTLAYLGLLPTTCKGVPGFDLIAHAVLVGLLAFFLDGALAFRPLFATRLPWLRLAPVLVISLAAVEEAAQSLSPRRTSSLEDFAADVIGICLFTWLAKRLDVRYGKPESVASCHFDSA